MSNVHTSAARCSYWTPNCKDIHKCVTNCRKCVANKVARQKQAGILSQHDVPTECWEHITADWASELPTSRRGDDTILVLGDKLHKLVILIQTSKEFDARYLVRLFETVVSSKHGVLYELSSYSDSKFVAEYWQPSVESKVITLNMAATAHSETDGLSEPPIYTLIEIPRPALQSEPRDSDKFLPLVDIKSTLQSNNPPNSRHLSGVRKTFDTAVH